MLLAVAYTQNLDPLGNRFFSTCVAALPVLILFYFLVIRRWLAPKAGLMGAMTAVVVAWLIYDMPLAMAAMSFVHGAAFGILPIGWTVFGAMLIYNITVETGQFAIIRRSVAALSNDARIQAILIGFAFGALMEGAAGAGSPVAICGAMLVGLGFPPMKAAVICLIANTSPVAYGGLGVPILTLSGVSDIPAETISAMAGHQLPILSCVIPMYMVLLMSGWRRTREVWPALAVAGGSFAIFQFVFATIHVYIPKLVLFPMTDVGGGMFSLIVTGIFLRFWKPKTEWHYSEEQKAMSLLAKEGAPLTAWVVGRAWMPFIVMSFCLMCSGFIRQEENVRTRNKVAPLEVVPRLHTRYEVPIPALDGEVLRAERLRKKLPDGQADNTPEKAAFEIFWVTAPGTPVIVAAIISMLFLRMSWRQIGSAVWRTCVQMRIPIPTIACMLGLSYVTRYAGMDATLGVAFAGTGLLYPFFAAILGWLGVFLTGTDAGSNALFGSLQKITAREVYIEHPGSFHHLERTQVETLICTANSTGGVMGKMIDAQSICVATAGTNQLGKEADIFKAVIWHSIFLACVVGLMTLIQAYVYPFTLMVPR